MTMVMDSGHNDHERDGQGRLVVMEQCANNRAHHHRQHRRQRQQQQQQPNIKQLSIWTL